MGGGGDGRYTDEKLDDGTADEFRVGVGVSEGIKVEMTGPRRSSRRTRAGGCLLRETVERLGSRCVLMVRDSRR